MLAITARTTVDAFHSCGSLASVAIPLLLSAAVASAASAPHTVGLGNILTTSDGGQIYGFDIDQNGKDGVLASAGYSGNTFFVSVQTFDEDSGKITKTFATKNSARNSYGVDGIFTGDVGLITHYIIPKGSIYAKRQYELMNPVTAKKFTGSWTPSLNDIDIQLVAENQATTTGVVYAIELKKQDAPVLIVSDIASNTFSNVIKLDPNLFSLSLGPHLGQYSAANQAVIGLSPDGGAVGGEAPLNYMIDLDSGKITSFSGYNNGPYHAGDVNGLATDPNTGVTATDTELNAQVEFYDIASQTGIAAVQLPCTGDADQGYSGSGITVDPVNKLFLVAAPDACGGTSGSIVVYDESGNYIETIPGIPIAIGEPPPAINPNKRMGWAFGSGANFSQLQQFFY
jgi:hypothetical protein